MTPTSIDTIKQKLDYVLSKVSTSALVPFEDIDILTYRGGTENGKFYILAGCLDPKMAIKINPLEDGTYEESVIIDFDPMFWDRVFIEYMGAMREEKLPDTLKIFPLFDDRAKVRIKSQDGSIKAITETGKTRRVTYRDLPPSEVQQLDFHSEIEILDGRIYKHPIQCKCGNVRYVKPQDAFQVTKCKPCTYADRRQRSLDKKAASRKKEQKEV